METISMFSRRSKLRRIIKKKKWESVRSLLKTKAAANHVNNTDTVGQSILSFALFSNAPVDIIASILKLSPTLSLTSDRCGILPIHIACFKGAGAEIVQLLLDHDFGACARALDFAGNSPLHCAVESVVFPKEAMNLDYFKEMSLSTGSSAAGEMMAMASRNSSDSKMTLDQEALNDRLKTIEILCVVAPELVRHANKAELSPIDLVQDVKVEHPYGSKWERADIVYQLLRSVNIQLYIDQKRLSEMAGLSRGSNASVVPSLVSSYGSSVSSGVGQNTVQSEPMDCSSEEPFSKKWQL